MDTVDLLRSDSLTLSCSVKDSDGNAIAFDSATFAIKDQAGSSSVLYTLSVDQTVPGEVSFAIPPGAINLPGNKTYFADITVVREDPPLQQTRIFQIHILEH